MRKHILLNTLFLLTFLLLIPFGFSLAKQSGDKKVTPITVDKQLIQFVESKEIATSKKIKEANKEEIKSLIALIQKSCGNFDTNVDLLSSAKCTTEDAHGDLVEYSMNCQDGYCNFSKVIHKPIVVKAVGQQNVSIQGTPNVPSKSAVGLGKWLKIFSGIIYVSLTIYLFMIAVSNLLKRELLYFIIDIILWAALTSAMYAVLGGM
jgi:hypothetical protein